MVDSELSNWITSDIPLTKEMFDVFKHDTRKLTSEDQLLFFKKVVNEIAKGNIALTIDDLSQIETYNLETIQEFDHPRELDYTLDLILFTLKSIHNRGSFPQDTTAVFSLVKDLADFICDYLQNKVEYLTNINLIFDNCPGRTSIVRKSKDESYIHLKENDYKVYGIYQGYTIENKDRKTGRGDLVLHFSNGIYAKGIPCLIEVLNKKINNQGEEEITYGNNIIYKSKSYPFVWKSDNNNYIITPDLSPVSCCEGRKSPIVCELSQREFWWCYGRKCFNANQIDHIVSEWKSYSLRDFIKILQLPFDDVGYYIFVGEINRLNRLLERIKCTDCNHVLRPSKQTHFGFYRVSHFRCNNDNVNSNPCPSFHKEIYLTHCLNSKCTNVIDDRVAKRCPNGFIICDKCGSCCSNDQFARRIQSLKSNGQVISQKLIDMLTNQSGHWERAECYCYKCQKEMSEDKNGGYLCIACKVHYHRYNAYVRFYKGYKDAREKKHREKQTKD